MINIDSLPVPSVFQSLDFEAILAKKIERAKELVPNWQPLESDDFKMILEDLAYEELHLRAEWNKLAKAFFLSTTTGSDLDNYAVRYGVERLAGSKPYATYEFSLSEILSQDVVIPANLILQDESSQIEAKLLESVTIFAGETTVSGVVELQQEVSSSDVKTEVITTPLPFVVEAKATGAFVNGSSTEDDETFRLRILLSMADKSTAGSEESYESFTRKSDERIADVKVLNGGAGVVQVFYYSEDQDEIMQTRIIEALNANKIRPISDDPLIAPAGVVSYVVHADLKILPNQETATVYSKAIDSLSTGLETLKKIGVQITLSEVNDFLKVPGVKEVIITSPSSNVSVADNEIGVNDEPNNAITYTVL